MPGIVRIEGSNSWGGTYRLSFKNPVSCLQTELSLSHSNSLTFCSTKTPRPVFAFRSPGRACKNNDIPCCMLFENKKRLLKTSLYTSRTSDEKDRRSRENNKQARNKLSWDEGNHLKTVIQIETLL